MLVNISVQAARGKVTVFFLSQGECGDTLVMGGTKVGMLDSN